MIMEGKIEKRSQTGREIKQAIYLIIDALVFPPFLMYLQL